MNCWLTNYESIRIYEYALICISVLIRNSLIETEFQIVAILNC